MLTLDQLNFGKSFRERVLYALLDHEQTEQVKLVFGRYLASSIASYPLNRLTNRQLRDDLLQKNEQGKVVEKFNFDEAGFKLVSDSFVSGYLGQIVRSYMTAYPRHRDFRLTANAAAVLHGVSRAAEDLKGAGETQTRHLKEARKTALYQFLSDSVKSGSVLDQFMRGDLRLSPDNIEVVHQAGSALADICHELADLRDRYDAEEEKFLIAGERGAGIKTALKDLLSGKEAASAEDVQLFMSTVSMLLLQAAKPLGTERFVPDKEIFLLPEDAVRCAEFITEECKRLGFHFNVTTGPDEPRAFDDLPEGALFKMGEDGKPQKLSLEENLAFVRSIQQWMGQHLASQQQRMAEFVEQRFTTIEEAIVDERVKEATPTAPLWASFDEAVKGREELGRIWGEKRSFQLGSMVKETWQALRSTMHFMVRDEALAETKKLAARAAGGMLPGYITKIADEFLKNFLRDGNGLSLLQRKKDAGGKVPLLGKTNDDGVFTRADMKRIFKSSTVKTALSPLPNSIGTVGLMEAVRVSDALAVDKAQRLLDVSRGVLFSAHQQTPQVAERLKLLSTGHPALDQWRKDEGNREALRRVLAKKPEARDKEDYLFLERYFRMVSSSAISLGEEALSPFGIGVRPEKIESVPEVMQRVLYQPVKNVPDAMLALSFTQGLVKESKGKFRSVDYVAPEEEVISAKQMVRFGRFMEQALARNGWVVAKGGEGDDITEGEVIKRTPKGVEKLSEEDIVAFANLSMDTLKRYVPMEKLLYSISGVEGEIYQEQFKEIFAPPEEKHPKEKAPPPVVQAEAHTWQERISRREFGMKRLFQNVKERLAMRSTRYDMKKLFSREIGATITCTIPNLLQNALLHKDDIISRSSVGSAIFKAGTYPFVYSYGIVYCKEAFAELFTQKNHVLHEVNLAERFMTAAVKSAAANDAELSGRMQEYLTSLGHLYQDTLGREYSDIPAISTKPVHERGREDDVLMAKFCNHFGEQLVSLSARLFGEEHAPRSVEEVVESTLTQPPATVQDALVTLSFLHSMVERDKQIFSATYFVPKDDRILKGKELRALSEFMNAYAQARGFMLVGAEDSKDKDYLPVIGKDKVPSAQEGEIIVMHNGAPRRVTNEELVDYAAQAVQKYHQLSQGKGASMVKGKATEVKRHLFQNLVSGASEPPKAFTVADEAEAFLASLTPEQREAIVTAEKPEEMPKALQQRMEQEAQKTSSSTPDMLKRNGSSLALM